MVLKWVRHSWVPALPWLIFGVGVALFSQTDNEAEAQFERAQRHWRAGRYGQAIDAYREVYQSYPESRFAVAALWESATLNYLSSYDLEKAVGLLERLVHDFPNHPTADRARAMLGEIHESALKDVERALYYWRRLDRPRVAAPLRRQALYGIGRALFELSRFNEARAALEGVCRNEPPDYLTQQANLRLAIIYQLRQQYERSLPHFLAVLEIDDCSDCRLQAQLGLIESYEFLDDLDSAVEVAAGLPEEDYPQKRELLERLRQKRHYYRSSAWKH